MKSIHLDIEYLESMLQMAFAVRFTYEKTGKYHVGELRYVYADINLAYATLHYLIYRLHGEKLAVSLELKTDNKLTITLNEWSKGIKIITNADSCNWADISAMIDTGDFSLVNDGDNIISIGIQHQVGFDAKNLYLWDMEAGKDNRAFIQGYMHKYNNDGLPNGPLGEGFF